MPASVELAPAKARAAAAHRKPTQAPLEEAINHGRIAAVTAPGFVQMQGGLPLVLDGHVVGTIAVSADTPEHDQRIAEAGAAALGQGQCLSVICGRVPLRRAGLCSSRHRQYL